MRAPATKKAVFKTTSIPAPVGGLNARESIANMPPIDAAILENFFPNTTSVDLRNGSVTWQEGLPGWAETVMAYNPGNANSSKLFAVSTNGAGADIYDVTQKGGTPAQLVTGLSTARLTYTNVANVAGWYLYACAGNGVDYPQVYNGTNWQQVTGVSTPFALTGTDILTGGAIDPRTLSCPTEQVQRLWFIQQNTCAVYFLPVGQIGGALSALNLQQFFTLGGSIVGMCSWTIDNINGVNVFTAFLSSEGEVLAYQGTDPTSASTWALLGHFILGIPVGARPFVRYAGDVCVINSDGLYPLSKALMADRNAEKEAVSAKIQNLINSDVANYSANFGWQVVVYPQGKKLLVNVPYVTDSNCYQYVMNTITGAWSKFTGWNAACWETQVNNLFFGTDGAVMLADTGDNDNGADITGLAQQAFNYLGAPGYNKIVSMVRPIFLTSGTVTPVVAVNTDFKTVLPTSTPSYEVTGTEWDTVLWDTAPWSSPSDAQANWLGVGGIGKAVTIYMKIMSQGQNVQWQATDYLYQLGGIL